MRTLANKHCSCDLIYSCSLCVCFVSAEKSWQNAKHIPCKSVSEGNTVFPCCSACGVFPLASCKAAAPYSKGTGLLRCAAGNQAKQVKDGCWSFVNSLLERNCTDVHDQKCPDLVLGAARIVHTFFEQSHQLKNKSSSKCRRVSHKLSQSTSSGTGFLLSAPDVDWRAGS